MGKTWKLGATCAAALFAVSMFGACAGGDDNPKTDAGGDATSCVASSTLCGGSCVDTQNDNANCGACGTACASGQVCSQGKCATSCGGGTKLCGSVCTDTEDDAQNCGTCGTKCGAGEVCSNGSCGSTCASGQTFCGGDGGAPYCASIKTDNANCGGCGIACGAGQVCDNGACASSCGGDDAGTDTLCTPDGGAPYCASTKTDNANCGGCGITCGAGETCQNGACKNACASSDGGLETLCTPDAGVPYCASTQSDNLNCGGCGVVCSAGSSCIGGTCKSISCPAFDGSTSQAGPDLQYGFCWYLSSDGKTCDAVCSALGGSNLAVSAENAWADACSQETNADVSAWFFQNGNAGGWLQLTPDGTSYHTLGYGYRNERFYGKCASGTTSGNGAFPGDTNDDSTRSVVCPCFVAK